MIYQWTALGRGVRRKLIAGPHMEDGQRPPEAFEGQSLGEVKG